MPSRPLGPYFTAAPLTGYNRTSNFVISLWPMDRAASLTYSLFAPNLKFRNSLVGLGQLQDRVLTVSTASHCQPVDRLSTGAYVSGRGLCVPRDQLPSESD